MIYYASTTAIRHGDDCYFLPPYSHRYIPSFQCRQKTHRLPIKGLTADVLYPDPHLKY